MERAGPRIEQLDGLRAIVHLRPKEGDGQVRQTIGQREPQVGVRVHQRLGLAVGA